MIDRAIGVAGLGLGIIAVVILTVFPVIKKSIAWGVMAVGAMLIVAAIVIAFIPEPKESTEHPAPEIHGNCNAVGNNNSNCSNSSN
jgi:hypothetical protein